MHTKYITLSLIDQFFTEYFGHLHILKNQVRQRINRLKRLNSINASIRFHKMRICDTISEELQQVRN